MTASIRTLVVLVLFNASGLAGPFPPETQVNPGAEAGPAAEGGRCKGQTEGASCWMELANHPGCSVWNSHFQPGSTVTWTAECAAGLAHGTGTLTEVWDGVKKTKEKTGSLLDGKPQGHWVYRDQNGTVAEGSYEDGERQGRWVERLTDGTVQEGPYEAGKRQGQWELRFASGTVMAGPFAAGRQQGPWVLRFASGNVSEGPYRAGEEQGPWVLRLANGTVMKGPFVSGKRHGHWVERDKDGYVLEGQYVGSLRHGWWVMRNKGLVVDETFFTDGEGQWQIIRTPR